MSAISRTTSKPSLGFPGFEETNARSFRTSTADTGIFCAITAEEMYFSPREFSSCKNRRYKGMRPIVALEISSSFIRFFLFY